jgi:hypothetical protein
LTKVPHKAAQLADRVLTNAVLTKVRLAKRREQHYKIRGFFTLTKCREADWRCTGNAVPFRLLGETGTGDSIPALSAFEVARCGDLFSFCVRAFGKNAVQETLHGPTG